MRTKKRILLRGEAKTLKNGQKTDTVYIRLNAVRLTLKAGKLSTSLVWPDLESNHFYHFSSRRSINR